MGRERGRKEIQLLTPPLFNKINAFHAPKVLSHKAVSSGHRDSFCVLLHQMDLAQILKFPPNSSLFTLHSSCYIILTLTLTSLITYYGRILSVLYCKLITEGMFAYKLKLYITAHLWEPCFPGNEHWAKVLIPLFSSQKTSWPNLWMTAGNKTLTHPLARLMETRSVWLYSCPFSIQGSWILTQARWIFGAGAHCLPSLLASCSLP